MNMTPLTCNTQLTPIGRSDMGQFKMLMRLIVTNAFSASNTLSADDSTYVANIARDTCDDNRGMQDYIKWNHFPCYWPFVRGNHRSPMKSPHKGKWRGALIFSLNCAWINGWVNNGEAGDLRRHHARYDATVMDGINVLHTKTQVS